MALALLIAGCGAGLPSDPQPATPAGSAAVSDRALAITEPASAEQAIHADPVLSHNGQCQQSYDDCIASCDDIDLTCPCICGDKRATCVIPRQPVVKCCADGTNDC
jgi:hypothetical protein